MAIIKTVNATTKTYYVVSLVEELDKNGNVKMNSNGESHIKYSIEWKGGDPEEAKRIASTYDNGMVVDENGLKDMERFCHLHLLCSGFVIKHQTNWATYEREVLEYNEREAYSRKEMVSRNVNTDNFTDEEWYLLCVKVIKEQWSKAYAYKVKNLSTPLDLAHEFYIMCYEDGVFDKYMECGASRRTYLTAVAFRYFSNVDKNRQTEMMSRVFSSYELAERDQFRAVEEQLGITSCNEDDLLGKMLSCLESECENDSRFYSEDYGKLNPRSVIDYMADHPGCELSEIAEEFYDEERDKEASVAMVSYNLQKARKALLANPDLRYKFTSRFEFEFPEEN